MVWQLRGDAGGIQSTAARLRVGALRVFVVNSEPCEKWLRQPGIENDGADFPANHGRGIRLR
jgi:hypothetical protein